jgi:hypothetical protein
MKKMELMEKIRTLVKNHQGIVPWLLLLAVGGGAFLVLQRCVVRLLR